MSIQFVIGGSGSGKTARLYQELVDRSIAEPEKPFLLIVPEQYSLQAQKDLVALHPGHGILNIDVVSFERLAHQIFEELGVTPGSILDDLGKNVLIRKAAATHREELGFYRRQVGRMGFTETVKSTLSEFYQYRIRPDILAELTGRAEHSESPLFIRKLRDIEILFRAFEEAREKGSITAEELLSELCPLLPRSRQICGATVVLDGYTGFTPIQYQVLEGFLSVAEKVMVSITIDASEDPLKQKGQEDLFYLSRSTAKALAALAEKVGTPVEDPILMKGMPRFPSSPELKHLETCWYRTGSKAYEGPEGGAIRFRQAEDRRSEVNWVSGEILRLVKEEGLRFRDIAVLTADLDGYARPLEDRLTEAGIPIFMDHKRSILNNPLVEMLRAALETVDRDFSYESLFRYARAGFSGVEDEELFELENYCIALGLRGASRFSKPFTVKKPYSRARRGGCEVDLDRINATRERLVAPLLTLREGLREKETSAAVKLSHIEAFLKEVKAKERMEELAAEMEAAHNIRAKLEYERLPEKLGELFAHVGELLGEEAISASDLSQVLDSGLEELKIGSIPPQIDRLTVGDLKRSRLGNIRVVFLVGFNEGILPNVGSGTGLLSDDDRERIAAFGTALAPTEKEQGFVEHFYLYLALTKASDRLYLSWHTRNNEGKTARPSVYLARLKTMFPALTERNVEVDLSPWSEDGWKSVTSREDGLAMVARGFREYLDETDGGTNEKGSLGFVVKALEEDKACEETIRRMAENAFGMPKTEKLTRSTAFLLYGNRIEGSVSRLESFSGCPFRHFLSYGLGLENRSEYEFASSDMGNLFHSALEECFKELDENNKDLCALSKEERSELVEHTVRRLAAEYGNTVLESSGKNVYLTENMVRMTERTMWALTEQLKMGEFHPASFEQSFSGKKDASLRIDLGDGNLMVLSGRIDRLDRYEDEEHTVLRVVDYKSGSTKFDLNKVYYGLQIQLAVYLAVALERERKKNPEKPVEAAGMYYYHIADPILDGDNKILTTESADAEKLKELKLKGLSSADERLARLQDRAESGTMTVIDSVRNKKDGNPTASAMEPEDFANLLAHVKEKMTQFGHRIAECEIAVSPYLYGKETPCTYCDFSTVCGFDPRLPGCEYNKMEKKSKDTIVALIGEGEEDDGMDE